MLFTSFSGSLVSRIPGAVQVTDAVMEQVVEWQNRPLDAVYPIVYLDCIVLKVRQ
ncbi:transposase, partial [Escherichia coli]